MADDVPLVVLEAIAAIRFGLRSMFGWHIGTWSPVAPEFMLSGREVGLGRIEVGRREVG
jgi:hypothetical protein